MQLLGLLCFIVVAGTKIEYIFLIQYNCRNCSISCWMSILLIWNSLGSIATNCWCVLSHMFIKVLNLFLEQYGSNDTNWILWSISSSFAAKIQVTSKWMPTILKAWKMMFVLLFSFLLSWSLSLNIYFLSSHLAIGQSNPITVFMLDLALHLLLWLLSLLHLILVNSYKLYIFFYMF